MSGLQVYLLFRLWASFVIPLRVDFIFHYPFFISWNLKKIDDGSHEDLPLYLFVFSAWNPRDWALMDPLLHKRNFSLIPSINFVFMFSFHLPMFLLLYKRTHRMVMSSLESVADYVHGWCKCKSVFTIYIIVWFSIYGEFLSVPRFWDISNSISGETKGIDFKKWRDDAVAEDLPWNLRTRLASGDEPTTIIGV